MNGISVLPIVQADNFISTVVKQPAAHHQKSLASNPANIIKIITISYQGQYRTMQIAPRIPLY